MSKPVLTLRHPPSTELETQLLVWDITRLLSQTMTTDQILIVASELKKYRKPDEFLIKASNWIEVEYL